MAWYDLGFHSRNAIKSKSSEGTVFIDLKDFQPSQNKVIGDDWDVQTGDIISWGNYRAANTYFVDEQRRLLENEDTSGSGYLTIPLSITRLFPSALKHYESLIENRSPLVSSVELASTDGIFAEKFGSPLPESIQNRTDIWYEYRPVEMILFVSVGKNEAQPFPMNGTNTKDIVDYIDVAKEKQAVFIVNYDVHDEQAYGKWPGRLKHGLLPVGWSCEQHGSSSGGHNYIQGAIKMRGPRKFKEEAYQIAKKHYDEFGVTITWLMN